MNFFFFFFFLGGGGGSVCEWPFIFSAYSSNLFGI